ncbi:MAG: MFS transporter, partial [Polyangiaceae bacterium]
IVGPAALPSAVRLAATARYLGVLVGPGIGSVVMLTLGPTRGIFLNTVFYLPLVFWLVSAPYGRHFRKDRSPPKRAVRGLADIVQTIAEVRKIPVLATMIVLAGGASFFVGNSYQAQMPGFAVDLGHGDPGTAYSVLLAADAGGALLAGILLESRGGIFAMRPKSALALAMVWGASLLGFALARSYFVAIALLFVAGFFELSFSSMAQTLVQMNAPEASRGRVLGLYNMSSAGLRAFSGITVGLVGSLMTVHASLAVAAGGFVVSCGVLMLWMVRT